MIAAIIRRERAEQDSAVWSAVTNLEFSSVRPGSATVVDQGESTDGAFNDDVGWFHPVPTIHFPRELGPAAKRSAARMIEADWYLFVEPPMLPNDETVERMLSVADERTIVGVSGVRDGYLYDGRGNVFDNYIEVNALHDSITLVHTSMIEGLRFWRGMVMGGRCIVPMFTGDARPRDGRMPKRAE